MGLVLDTDVIIGFERAGSGLSTSGLQGYGEVFISAVTVSELLVGVHRADTDARRVRRAAFVEAVLTRVGVLPFTHEVARIHAEVFATLAKKGQLIGAHDLVIASTALYHGFPMLTGNITEFGRVEGVRVLSWPPPPP